MVGEREQRRDRQDEPPEEEEGLTPARSQIPQRRTEQGQGLKGENCRAEDAVAADSVPGFGYEGPFPIDRESRKDAAIDLKGVRPLFDEGSIGGMKQEIAGRDGGERQQAQEKPAPF